MHLKHKNLSIPRAGRKTGNGVNMKLKDFGFLGTLPPDEPEKLTLFYDYDYPLMDYPLLMANFSI